MRNNPWLDENPPSAAKAAFIKKRNYVRPKGRTLQKTCFAGCSAEPYAAAGSEGGLAEGSLWFPHEGRVPDISLVFREMGYHGG